MENDINNQREISRSELLIDEISYDGLNSKPNGEKAFIEFRKHIGIEVENEEENEFQKLDVCFENKTVHETFKTEQIVATTQKDKSDVNENSSGEVTNDLNHCHATKFKAYNTKDDEIIGNLLDKLIKKNEQDVDVSDNVNREDSILSTNTSMSVASNTHPTSIKKSSITDEKSNVNINEVNQSSKMSDNISESVDKKLAKVVLRQFENMLVYLNDVPHKSRNNKDDNVTKNNAFSLSKNIDILKKKSIKIEWTALDANRDFMFIGSSNGTLFIFDRKYGVLKKSLFSRDNPYKITRVKLIDESKCLVAIGNTHGLVSVFHFHDRDDIVHKMSVYMIEKMHNSEISSLEWGGGGKVLFSGDVNGLVVLTELNWSMNNSRSRVVRRESSSIVQLSHHFPCILISTLDHTIIYNLLRCKVVTVGQLERKKPGPYGATFDVESDSSENIATPIDKENKDEINNGLDKNKVSNANEDIEEDKNFKDRRDSSGVKILACRQNMRLWQADVAGVVQFTYVFKNQINEPSKNIYLFEFDNNETLQNENTVFGAYQFYNIYPFVVREHSSEVVQAAEYHKEVEIIERKSLESFNDSCEEVTEKNMHNNTNQIEVTNLLEHRVTEGIIQKESKELKESFDVSLNDKLKNPPIDPNCLSSCDDNTTSGTDRVINYRDGVVEKNLLLNVNGSNTKVTSSENCAMNENSLSNEEKNKLSKDEGKQNHSAHVKSSSTTKKSKNFKKTKKYYITHDSKSVYLLDLECSTIECHCTFESRIIDVVVGNDVEEILVLLEENTINRNKLINLHNKSSQSVGYKETRQAIANKMASDLVKDSSIFNGFQPLIRLSTNKMPSFQAKPITSQTTSNVALNKISKMAAEWTNLAGVVKEESFNVAKKIATTSTTMAKQLNKINYEEYTRNINNKVVNFTSNIASSIIKEDRKESDKDSDKFETSSIGSFRDYYSASGVHKTSHLNKEADNISKGSYNDDKKDLISLNTCSASADGDNDNNSDIVKPDDYISFGQFDLNEPIVFETKRLVRKRRVKKAGKNEKKKSIKEKGEMDLETDLQTSASQSKPSYGIDLNLLKGNNDDISEDIIFADFIKKYGFLNELINKNNNIKNNSNTSLDVNLLQKDHDIISRLSISKSISFSDIKDSRVNTLKESLKRSIESIKFDCKRSGPTHTNSKEGSFGAIFNDNNNGNNQISRSRSLCFLIDNYNKDFSILKSSNTAWKSNNSIIIENLSSFKSSDIDIKDNLINKENEKLKENGKATKDNNSEILNDKLNDPKELSGTVEKKLLIEEPNVGSLQVSIKENDFLNVDYPQTHIKNEKVYENHFEEEDEEEDENDSIPYEDMFSHLLTTNKQGYDEIDRINNDTNNENDVNKNKVNDSKFTEIQNGFPLASNKDEVHPHENPSDFNKKCQDTTMKDNCELKTLSENIQKSIDEISYNNNFGNNSHKELLQELVTFSKDQKQGLKDSLQCIKTTANPTQKEPSRNTSILTDINSTFVTQPTTSDLDTESKCIKFHRLPASSSSSLCLTKRHIWLVINKNLYRSVYHNGSTDNNVKDYSDNTKNFHNNEDDSRFFSFEENTNTNNKSPSINKANSIENDRTLTWKKITSNVDSVAVSPSEVNIWVLRSVASLSSSLLWFSSSSSSSSSVLLVLCRRFVLGKNSKKEVKLEWREGDTDVEFITMPTDSLAFIIKKNGDLFYQSNLSTEHSYSKSIKINLGFPVKRLVYQNDVVWVMRADHQLNAFIMDDGVVHLQRISSTPINVFHSAGVQSYHLNSNGCAWVVLRNRDVMFCEGVAKKSPEGNGLWYKVPFIESSKQSKDKRNVFDKEMEESLVIRGDANSIWLHNKPMGIICQLMNHSMGYRFESKCMLNSNGSPFPPLFSHLCISKGTVWLVQRLGQLCSFDLLSSSSSPTSPSSSLTSSLSSSSSQKSKSNKFIPDSHPLATSFSSSSSLTSSTSMSNSTLVPVLNVPSVLLTSPLTRTSISREKNDFFSAFKNKLVSVTSQALLPPLMDKDGANIEINNNHKNNNKLEEDENIKKVVKKDSKQKSSSSFLKLSTPSLSQQEYLRIFLFPTSNNKIITISSTAKSLWCLYDNGEVFTLILKSKSAVKSKDDFEVSGGSFEDNEGRFVSVNLSQLTSDLVHLSAGSKGVWACDKLGQVYMRIGSKVRSEEHGLSAVWLPLRTSFTAELEPIRFKRVYVSQDCCIVWGVDTENNLYARFGIDLSYSIGTHWILVDGIKCSFMALGHRCVVVGADNGNVYLREGITKSEPSGTSWTFLFNSTAESFCSLACNGDNDFWFLDPNGLIHHMILHKTFHLIL